MRKIHIAVPIAAALLVAATGCSGSTTGTTAAPSSAAASTTQPQPTPSTQQSSTSAEPVSDSSDSSGGTGKPFPGIWDITSWKQLYAVEASVSQGHQPWLLDPSMVVQAWTAQWKADVPVRQVGADTFQVVKPGTHTTYTIRGTRPDPANAAPVWVITSITHD